MLNVSGTYVTCIKWHLSKFYLYLQIKVTFITSKLVTKINPKNFEHIMLKAMKEHKARVEAVALTFTSMSNFKLKLHKEM